MDLFPWMAEFKKMCSTLLTQQSMASLTRLMQYFERNVSLSVQTCYKKPARAAKLKESINEALLLFLYFYRELPQSPDNSVYLDTMSNLVAMFVDMELKASKRGKEQYSKISARLTLCLYIYLDYSTEHMLDTLMKVRSMNHNYQHILDPVIAKILKSIPLRPESSTMYVRYILAYRLWRKINSNNMAIKKEIVSSASSALGPPPIDISTFQTEKILPPETESQVNSTKYFLLHNFNTETSCQLFLQYCKKRNTKTETEDSNEQCKSTVNLHTEKEQVASTDSSMPINNTNYNSNSNNNSSSNNKKNLISSDNDFSFSNDNSHDNSLLESNVTKNNSTALSHSSNNKKPVSFCKSKANSLKKKPRKNGEIVLIDLTTDKPNGKVIKRKQNRPQWLDDIEKMDGRSTLKINEDILTNSTLEDCLKEMLDPLPFLPDVNTEDTNENDPAVNVSEASNEDVSEETTEASCCEINSNLSSLTIGNDSSAEAVLELPTFTEDESCNNSRIKALDVSLVKEDQSSIKKSGDTVKTDIDERVEMDCTDAGEQKKDIAFRESTSLEDDDVATEVNEKKLEEVDVKSSRASRYALQGLSESREENIDGLTLLASVSQQLARNKIDASQEQIKVKDYATLKKSSSEEDCSRVLHLCDNASGDMINRIIGIYPEDALDKVALQVEVTTSNESTPTESNTRYVELNEMQNNLMLIDTAAQQGIDTTNVILNGETVILLQKSPNSNMYIINKAVENKPNSTNSSSNSNSSSNISSDEEVNEAVLKEEQVSESSENMDQFSPKVKTVIGRNGLVKVEMEDEDVMKGSPGLELNNRKSFRYQDSKSAPHWVPPHANYALQKYSPMHPHNLIEQQLPLPHSTSISQMYPNFPASSDLCMSYHKHCSSVSCNIPVNAGPNTQPHSSCPTCAYEAMTHYRQCILPGNDPRPSYIEGNSYFLQPQPNIERTSSDVIMSDLYENQFLRKIEKEILEGKPIKDVEIDYKKEMTRRIELDSKLPPKKRIKAHMTSVAYDDVPLKMAENYPRTSMMSIAHIELQNGLDTAEIEMKDEPFRRHQNAEIIHHNYGKNTVIIAHEKPPCTRVCKDGRRLDKQKTPEKMSKTSKKSRDTKQTRSSKRKVPKVNYSCSELDPEWNPSGDAKRKRKKNSR